MEIQVVSQVVPLVSPLQQARKDSSFARARRKEGTNARTSCDRSSPNRQGGRSTPDLSRVGSARHEAQPGYEGVMEPVERSTGKAISLSLWKTEAAALASGVSSPYIQANLAKLASFFAGAVYDK